MRESDRDSVCVCKCVCERVCVREKYRGRERENGCIRERVCMKERVRVCETGVGRQVEDVKPDHLVREVIKVNPKPS